MQDQDAQPARRMTSVGGGPYSEQLASPLACLSGQRHRRYSLLAIMSTCVKISPGSTKNVASEPLLAHLYGSEDIAIAKEVRNTGDWSSPGLAAPVDNEAPRYV